MQFELVPVQVRLLKYLIQKLPRGRMPLLNLFHSYFPKGLYKDRWLNLQMIFNLKDRDSWLLYFNEISERYQTPYFLKFLFDGATFFDIGANNGYYSLLAACSAKNTRAFAFEANPKLVEQLAAVIQMNSLDKQVNVISGAVCDEEKEVQLDFSNVNHQGTGHIVYKQGDSHLTTVPGFTIDSWMNSNNIQHADIIKIDVEGAEMNVLRGMKTCLQKHAADILFIEVHNEALPDFGTSSTELFDFLNNLNYELRALPSEFTILPGNRYKPSIKDIPLIKISDVTQLTGGWWHCIAFSKAAANKHRALLNL